MNNIFISELSKRRTYYGLDKNITVAPELIQKLVESAVIYTPSAFNSQSARVAVLFGEHHERIWDITKETLRKIVPAGVFAKTEEKINSFAAGAGTVLYFEEMKIIEELQGKFPAYRDNFPVWSLESNGMLQLNVWVALETEGLGASLQHYNPLIDEEVKAHWKFPGSWELLAEMPFGNPIAAPDPKDTIPASERVYVFK